MGRTFLQSSKGYCLILFSSKPSGPIIANYSIASTLRVAYATTAKSRGSESFVLIGGILSPWPAPNEAVCFFFVNMRQVYAQVLGGSAWRLPRIVKLPWVHNSEMKRGYMLWFMKWRIRELGRRNRAIFDPERGSGVSTSGSTCFSLLVDICFEQLLWIYQHSGKVNHSRWDCYIHSRLVSMGWIVVQDSGSI